MPEAKMHDERSVAKSAERDCQLEQGEAFDLYVRGIARNLASLLEQFILLRGIVEGKRAPPNAESETSTTQ
jgi:hypothetical protein